VQPQGPYYLAGWCFGGSVAHQMATQLQAAGQQVALLALVSATPSNTPPDGRRIATPGDLAVSERQLLRDVLNGFDVDLPDLDGQELDQPTTLAVIRAQSGPAGGLAEDSILALIRVLRNNIWMSVGFVPDVFQGSLLYFASTIDGVPAARWEPYLTGRIEVHEVAARHDHMTHATAVARIGRVIGARLTAGGSGGSSPQASTEGEGDG
jgi:thioesterase domain-containing protein